MTGGPDAAARPKGEIVCTDTVVIGAGPAGLATGACLRTAGAPAVILEQSDRVGPVWHRHYDRLRLHTDKARSALPFLPMPKGYPRYPTRGQVIEYLETYARRFDLRPRFGERVISARRNGDRWEAETRTTRYRSRNLVVATGNTRAPYIPDWPGRQDYRGALLHSAEYRDGKPFRGQEVLVVGFGNSGGEIAMDLWEHGAKPSLSVRGPVNVVPRDLLGIPILALSIPLRRLPAELADAATAPVLRALYGDLRRLGLRKLPYGPMAQIVRDGRIPLLDVGTMKMIKRRQIETCPGIAAFTEDGVIFDGGTARRFDAVVLATGYRPAIDSLLPDAAPAIGAHGRPAVSGRESPVAGLYFCGFYVSPAGMLREIAIEARHIARHIAAKGGDAEG